MLQISDLLKILVFGSFLVLLACSAEVNQADEVAKSDSSESAVSSELPSIFADAQFGHLDSMDVLCSRSKAYQQAEWKELNHCRWALEKAILAKIPEYAKRNGDRLSLQMDDGKWMALEHAYDESGEDQFFQFRSYLPNPHIFLITQHLATGCPTQWVIDAKSGQKMFFPGYIWQHPELNVFITGKGPEQACGKEAHLIHFTKAGDIKFEKLKLSGALNQVKWTDTQALFEVIGKEDKLEYRRWVLP